MKYILLFLFTVLLWQVKAQGVRPPKDSRGIVVTTTLKDNALLDTIARFMNEHKLPVETVDRKNKIITSQRKELGLVIVQDIVTVNQGIATITGFWWSTDKLTELTGEKFVRVPTQYRGQGTSYDKRAYASLDILALGIDSITRSGKITYLPANE